MRYAVRPGFGLIGELPHAGQVQPFLRREEQAEQQRRADRERVQHDRGADRGVVRRAEEHRRADAKRLVKSADRARRRHGDADRPAARPAGTSR